MVEYAWPTIELATIPTGGDPRRLTTQDQFPQMVVQITSSVQAPAGLNKAMLGVYGLAIFFAFMLEDGEDPNLQKLQRSEEIWDFICTHHEGDTYSLFMTDKGDAPAIDYYPMEEMVLQQMNQKLALIKFTFPLKSPATYFLAM